ncbi:protein of unknown function [Acidithiobacillus ferrivorans]|uniref:Uncharacterized protein n=1 Tax=Acidithiobacillus ferrivorans TaxID=160808 RepID=A0A060UZU1_9PROT|nr:hypothetical protein [Acidithiobacillus ferrivorans]CDQ11944.1 hypothetical protein AFERRI_600170 [Acidithiobacillus ferrivorans]SMH65500.1 protein of unknown function [Acidithiobacillus ferrivorans]
MKPKYECLMDLPLWYQDMAWKAWPYIYWLSVWIEFVVFLPMLMALLLVPTLLLLLLGLWVLREFGIHFGHVGGVREIIFSADAVLTGVVVLMMFLVGWLKLKVKAR